MSNLAKVYFLLFNLYVLVLLACAFQLWQSLSSAGIALLAAGLALYIGLIVVMVWDLHRQHVSDAEKIVWTLMFLFIWPTVWLYFVMFGLAARSARAGFEHGGEES